VTLKTGTTLGLISFGIAFAYYASNRLSTDALNLAVGVLCGIAASVPVSLGLLVALSRQRNPTDEDPLPEYAHPTFAYGAARRQMPQVIVLTPPHGKYTEGPAPFGCQVTGSSPDATYAVSQSDDFVRGRDWRIIGEDE
jgi:hypothetical protein